MVENVQQAKDDIAFIKGFLGSDGRAPVAVGHFYLVVGAVFALEALRQFALDLGWEAPSIVTALRPWDTLALLLWGFAVSSTVMWRRGQSTPDQPQHLNPAARAALSCWGAVSFTVAAGFLSLWLSGIDAFAVAGLILFAAGYSVGWSVTHAVYSVGWHRLVAWGFVVWAVALGIAADSTSLPLVIAIGLVLLFALPGYRIVADANRAESAGRTVE